MGEGRKVRKLSGFIFVGCMFIGWGIGLLFNRSDVGFMLGMGVGFVLMGIIQSKDIKVSSITLSFPRSFGQILISTIGLFFISNGVFLLYNPDLFYPYGLGIGTVIIGVFLLIVGLGGWFKKEDNNNKDIENKS